MTAQACVIDIMISAVVVQRDVRPEGRGRKDIDGPMGKKLLRGMVIGWNHCCKSRDT
jgi:hypothetical protein